mmetsp:Transcript_12221/g.22184  ORF Transcript_12221/g.22184 Transcript_12221/m.22184 type:complete len:223 (+) Transcript_12221:1963-2631(+)
MSLKTPSWAYRLVKVLSDTDDPPSMDSRRLMDSAPMMRAWVMVRVFHGKEGYELTPCGSRQVGGILGGTVGTRVSESGPLEDLPTAAAAAGTAAESAGISQQSICGSISSNAAIESCKSKPGAVRSGSWKVRAFAHSCTKSVMSTNVPPSSSVCCSASFGRTNIECHFTALLCPVSFYAHFYREATLGEPDTSTPCCRWLQTSAYLLADGKLHRPETECASF